MGKQGFCLGDILNSAGLANRATNGFRALCGGMLLLSRWYQAATVGARRVLLLMLFAVGCSPGIHEVFTQKRLTAVSTPESNLVSIAYSVVGRSLVHVETGIRDGMSTGSTHKMFGMPRAT